MSTLFLLPTVGFILPRFIILHCECFYVIRVLLILVTSPLSQLTLSPRLGECCGLTAAGTARRNISFIPYPTRAPITLVKGPRGRTSRSPRYLNQARPRCCPGLRSLTASRLYQRTPTMVYTCKFFHAARLGLTFLRSGSGLIFILKNI